MMRINFSTVAAERALAYGSRSAREVLLIGEWSAAPVTPQEQGSCPCEQHRRRAEEGKGYEYERALGVRMNKKHVGQSAGGDNKRQGNSRGQDGDRRAEVPAKPQKNGSCGMGQQVRDAAG